MRWRLLLRGVSSRPVSAVAAIGTLLLAMGLLAASPQTLASDAMARPVLNFQQTLLAVMKDGASLGFAGRKARLQTMVDEAIDMPAIIQSVLGGHYATMAATEREALGQRINEYAIATLASRFRRYDGERFAESLVRAVRGDRARLSAEFVDADGDVTGLSYDLRAQGERWRIINISFDGVSGTDIQRAEFEAFLRDGGTARLVEKLDALIVYLQGNGD
jgi:hopanoid biosynthesis associated membrane protein HpnM